MVREVPFIVQRRGAHHIPRPRFSEPSGNQGACHRAGRGCAPERQLRPLSGLARTIPGDQAGGRGKAGARGTTAIALRGAISLQGEEGQPGAKPSEATREDADYRVAEGDQESPLLVPGGAARRIRGHTAGQRKQVIWRKRRLPRHELDPFTRRSCRPGRTERRRQDHHAEIARRRHSIGRRREKDRPQRCHNLLRTARARTPQPWQYAHRRASSGGPGRVGAEPPKHTRRFPVPR